MSPDPSDGHVEGLLEQYSHQQPGAAAHGVHDVEAYGANVDLAHGASGHAEQYGASMDIAHGAAGLDQGAPNVDHAASMDDVKGANAGPSAGGLQIGHDSTGFDAAYFMGAAGNSRPKSLAIASGGIGGLSSMIGPKAGGEASISDLSAQVSALQQTLDGLVARVASLEGGQGAVAAYDVGVPAAHGVPEYQEASSEIPGW